MSRRQVYAFAAPPLVYLVKSMARLEVIKRIS